MVDGQQVTITAISGTNSAGKSSLLGEHLRQHGGEYFNPDEVAHQLRQLYPELSQAEANALAWTAGRDRLEEAIEPRRRLAPVVIQYPWPLPWPSGPQPANQVHIAGHIPSRNMCVPGPACAHQCHQKYQQPGGRSLASRQGLGAISNRRGYRCLQDWCGANALALLPMRGDQIATPSGD